MTSDNKEFKAMPVGLFTGLCLIDIQEAQRANAKIYYIIDTTLSMTKVFKGLLNALLKKMPFCDIFKINICVIAVGDYEYTRTTVDGVVTIFTGTIESIIKRLSCYTLGHNGAGGDKVEAMLTGLIVAHFIISRTVDKRAGIMIMTDSCFRGYENQHFTIFEEGVRIPICTSNDYQDKLEEHVTRLAFSTLEFGIFDYFHEVCHQVIQTLHNNDCVIAYLHSQGCPKPYGIDYDIPLEHFTEELVMEHILKFTDLLFRKDEDSRLNIKPIFDNTEFTLSLKDLEEFRTLVLLNPKTLEHMRFIGSAYYNSMVMNKDEKNHSNFCM